MLRSDQDIVTIFDSQILTLWQLVIIGKMFFVPNTAAYKCSLCYL